MTGFEAIDALLAAVKEEVPLPSVEERRALREQLNLSRAQVPRSSGSARRRSAAGRAGAIRATR